MLASWLPSRATPTIKTTTRNITPTMKSTSRRRRSLSSHPCSRNEMVTRAGLPRAGGNRLDETLRAPLDAELARRRHVAEQRGRSDDRRAREVAEAADPHAVGPVAVERGDRALA